MEITYTKHGDYYLPDSTLPKEEPATYRYFCGMRLKYLKEHRRGIYTSLLTSAQLTHHLNEIDREAMVDILIYILRWLIVKSSWTLE